MKNKYKYIIIVFIVLFLIFPVKASATIYTRSSGNVTITAPKSKSYQWYVKKNERWKKIKGENRRNLTLLCSKKMNGYRYRCRLNNKKWSKSEKIVITDIGKRYQRSIDKEKARGLFLPKCADGYCFVHCTYKPLSIRVRKAIDIVNNKIGRTFVYTDSPHIADIIIQKWRGNKLYDSIWLKSNEIDIIKKKGKEWAGVAFSEDSDGLHHLVCINTYYTDYDNSYYHAVIIHELGHCIGIGHSQDKKSIMYPIAQMKCRMTQNDILTFKAQRKKIRAL